MVSRDSIRAGTLGGVSAPYFFVRDCTMGIEKLDIRIFLLCREKINSIISITRVINADFANYGGN